MSRTYDVRQSLAGRARRPALLLAGYVALAAVGVQWGTVRGAASPVFPAAGAALAGLAIFGLRLWPAVFLGRLLTFWLTASTLPTWTQVTIAAGNAAAASLGAAILRGGATTPVSLSRVPEVLRLVGAAFASACVGASVGTSALAIAFDRPVDDSLVAWLNWCTGDLLGVMVVAPVLFVWTRRERAPRSFAGWLHLALATCMTALTAWLVFGPPDSPMLWPWLVFPVMMWSALACEAQGASSSILAMTAVAVWGTTMGQGPFAATAAEAGLPGLRFVMLQQFVLVASASTLLVAAVAGERRGREALKASEERLALALEAGQLGFWDWDVPSGRVHFGGRWAEMLGYDLHEIEPHVRSWEQLIHPHDKPALLDRLREHLEGRTEFYESEYRLRHRDGSWRWILGRGRVVARDAQARPLRATGTHADVTQRRRAETALRESEARFRALADNIAQLAWMTDETGTPLWLNRRWYEYTGAPQSAVVSETWRSAVHPDHLPRVQEKFQHHLASGEPWEDTFPLRAADGSHRWFLSRAQPIRDESGRITRWFGTNTDITAHREAEQTLRQAVQLRDEFLSVASHELRTPLTALALQLDSLHKLIARGHPGDAPRAVRKVETAIRQSERLGALIEGLLDVSRIASGRLQLQLEPFDLRELVREATERLAEVAAHAHCEIRVRASGPVDGCWDRSRLDQVLINLLGNAIKYGPGHPIDVELEALHDTVSLCVRDRGIGIAEQDRQRVFGRFERAVSASHYGGLGLGLYIARQIVEAHGGQIDVESVPGEGATFVVLLPRGTRRHEVARERFEARA